MPEYSVAERPRPSLRARIAGFGLRRTIDFAAWRHRREARRAERRGRTDQVFRAFIQINVYPRAR
ncbi:hypothetical protein ACFODL_07430 [Phenylobacterium terrae]|uniref:Uncharacterized protein n=1 Tax=Phenylobacterium terrae TaxID=2665495 RepID=A0ABW4N4A5_9CAUL